MFFYCFQWFIAIVFSFLNKNTAFAERLKRAEHNAATRLKRRGATTAASSVSGGGNTNTAGMHN